MSNIVNILYLSPLYSPARGGAETHIKTLAEGMAGKHTVYVITEKLDAASKQYEEINGVKVFRISGYHSYFDRSDKVAWEICYFGMLNEIKDIIDKIEIDIIHAQCQVSILIGSILKEEIGCKLIATYHETTPEKDKLGTGRTAFLYKRMPYDILCVGSKFFKEHAVSYGVSEEKIKMIYMGIDVDHYSRKNYSTHYLDAIKTKYLLSEKAIKLLLIGRFKERKGQKELIEAVSLLRKEHKNIKCYLVGTTDSASCSYLETLQKHIKKLQLEENVIILQNVPDEDLPGIIIQSDLVIQPSHAEGLCLSLLEAMALEKPVVTTYVSGIKEIIIPSYNGNTANVDDFEDLAKVIAKTLENKTKTAEMAQKGYQTVLDKFNLYETIKKTTNLYEEILQEE